MKLLVVGDVHAQVGCLQECEQLIDFIVEKILKHNPFLVIFLGDQYHNHSVVRVEVMEFWRKSFDKLLATGLTRQQIIALVGNHDKSSDATAHAMLAHEDKITVVSEWLVFGKMLFLPYMDNESFVKKCNEEGAFGEIALCDTVFCHQTFQGFQYDNGFYASDGIDLNLIPQKRVVSGHIHTQQRIGRCWYPGSPRWMGISDANVSKAVWLIDEDVASEPIPQDTYEICRPIRAIVETPESIHTEPLQNHVSYVVDLRGSPAWIEERLSFWKDKARVRTFPVETATAIVKESEGVSVAFGKYADSYQPKHGTDKEVLKKLARERIWNQE